MAIPVVLRGASKSIGVEIEKGGIVPVTLKPSFEDQYLALHFSNISGTNMAINASIGGSSNIWNGTGVNDIGEDWEHSLGTESTLAKHSGTNGLDIELPQGVRIEFTGTAINMSNFSSIELWINPQAGWSSGNMEFELRYLGVRVGNKLDLTLYMTSPTVGVWQLISIPTNDFGTGINLVDNIRLKAKTGTKNFFLDDMVIGSIVGTDNPLFAVIPPPSIVFHINRITLNFLGASPGGNFEWEPNNFGSLDSKLDAGLLFRSWDKGKILESHLFLTNHEINKYCQIRNSIIGDTNISVSYNILTDPIILDGNNGDRLEFLVRDNLDPMLDISSMVHGTYFKISK